MSGNASQKIFDCIVMGAGLSGVTAARNLQLEGFDVLLLEGSDRIGGRIQTVRDLIRDPDKPDAFLPIEAGAEYLHVAKQRRYGEFWEELESHGFSHSIFHKTGSLVPAEEPRNRTFFPIWGQTKTLLETLADEEVFSSSGLLLGLTKFRPKRRRDYPAGQFVRERKDYPGRGRLMAEYTLSAHTPGLLDEPAPQTPPGGPDPNDTISVAGIAADKIPAQLLELAERRLELKRPGKRKICGNSTLPRKILAQLRGARGTIKISQEGGTEMKVVRVERSSDGLVTVETEGGDSFRGRTAICTFSVGMLDPVKGEGDAIFGELLTAEKREALRLVPMGPITKFSLEFKERVWKDGTWAGHMSVLSHPTGDARTFFSAFPDQQRGPHVLTALLMSKDHRKIRGLDDKAAIQHLLDVLQKIYDPRGDRFGKPWKPEKLLVGERRGRAFRPSYFRKDWERDPFAKGGNSFQMFVPKEERGLKVTETREALKNPRETLPLFWAGEATAPAYARLYQPLSLHGAYISGVRVAEDVQKYLKLRGDARRFEKFYVKKYPWVTRD